MKIAIVECLDHFETSTGKTKCLIGCIGIIVDENKEYLYLKKVWWRMLPRDDDTNKDEVEGIVKSTITYRKDYDVDEIKEKE